MKQWKNYFLKLIYFVLDQKIFSLSCVDIHNWGEGNSPPLKCDRTILTNLLSDKHKVRVAPLRCPGHDPACHSGALPRPTELAE